MSGHGTGATGTGQQGARRQRKILHDSIKRITKPSILRLARRAGVTRINERVYEAVRAALRDYLSRILRDATVYCEHARRKTMKSMDVIYALRRQGNALYGHGP